MCVFCIQMFSQRQVTYIHIITHKHVTLRGKVHTHYKLYIHVYIYVHKCIHIHTTLTMLATLQSKVLLDWEYSCNDYIKQNNIMNEHLLQN